MFLVGLSGGIASGKSTVVAVLRELGCAVIDADVIAREGEFGGAELLPSVSPDNWDGCGKRRRQRVLWLRPRSFSLPFPSPWGSVELLI